MGISDHRRMRTPNRLKTVAKQTGSRRSACEGREVVQQAVLVEARLGWGKRQGIGEEGNQVV